MSVQQIGKHRVRHGDVNDGLAQLMGADRARIMYSDPPWGEGNIKYWATMNKKMNDQDVEPAPLSTFLDSVFQAAQTYVTDYLLIEYGRRWAAEIISRGQGAGFEYEQTITILYRGGKNGQLIPLDLHVFTRNGAPMPPRYIEQVANTSGFDCVKKAFYPFAELLKSKYPDEEIIALDPCCGMGYTAQASINCGFSFRGNELNRKRLDKTVARLQKA
jgi:hypothetical protein